MASTLKELTGATTAAFGLYDPHQREIHVKHAGLGSSLITDLMRSLGGKKLAEAGFPVSEAIRRDLIETPVRIQASLSEITFGPVPPWVGKVVQQSGSTGLSATPLSCTASATAHPCTVFGPAGPPLPGDAAVLRQHGRGPAQAQPGRSVPPAERGTLPGVRDAELRWAEGQSDRGAVFYFALGSEARSQTPPTTDKEATGTQ